MKKLLSIVVLVMSVMVVNAQTEKSTPGASDSKAPAATTVTTIQAANLPKTITDNINKDYPGYTIKEATSVSGKNGLNYQVEVMKGTTTETLLYDKDGKFLRKVSPKSEMKHDMKK